MKAWFVEGGGRSIAEFLTITTGFPVVFLDFLKFYLQTVIAVFVGDMRFQVITSRNSVHLSWTNMGIKVHLIEILLSRCQTSRLWTVQVSSSYLSPMWAPAKLYLSRGFLLVNFKRDMNMRDRYAEYLIDITNGLSVGGESKNVAADKVIRKLQAGINQQDKIPAFTRCVRIVSLCIQVSICSWHKYQVGYNRSKN